MSGTLHSSAVRALLGVRPRSEPSGHVYLREGKRGPVWYAKYRLPDGVSARFADLTLEELAELPERLRSLRARSGAMPGPTHASTVTTTAGRGTIPATRRGATSSAARRSPGTTSG